LTFVRSVGANKVVDAIVEALSGKNEKYKKSLKEFEQLLLDGIGEGGVQNNDTIDFVLKGVFHNSLLHYFFRWNNLTYVSQSSDPIIYLSHLLTSINNNISGKSEIGVAVRGKLGGFVNNHELREKLIEVYTGEKKAVAPEVVKALKKRYSKCD